MKHTLDHNCLIALEGQHADRERLEGLIKRHGACGIEVFVPAIAASERRPGGLHIEQWDEFEARMERIGAGHLPNS